MMEYLTTMVTAVRRLHADVGVLNDHIQLARDRFLPHGENWADMDSWQDMLRAYFEAAEESLDAIAAVLPPKKEG